MKKVFCLLLMMISILTIIGCVDNQEQPGVEDGDNIKHVITLIEELPEEFNAGDHVKYETIDLEYSNLTTTEKAEVTNYDDYLVKKEQYYAKLDEYNDNLLVNSVIEQIASLDKLITLDDVTMVTSARSAYNSLSSILQAKVTNLEILENAEKQIVLLNHAAVVINLIAGIKDIENITLEDADDIQSIYDAYLALSIEEQALVDNYNVLVDAMSKINDLEEAESYRLKAEPIIELIDALPSVEDLTYDDKNSIAVARNRYTALPYLAKAYVTNLSKLEALEEKIKELQIIENYKQKAELVNNLIDALPSVSALTLDDEAAVVYAREQYDALGTEEKAYVTNLDTLVNAENRIKELIASRAYSVNFYLNGGTLEGANDSNETEVVAEFNVNYYSTGYWTVYETDICIYKTNLISASDTYLYAYKVGFSYNETLKSYLVDAIYPAGTGLTEDNRTSQYYIIVHTSNTSGFEIVSNLEINNYITFSTSLPETATSALNANVVVTKQNAVSSSYVTLDYVGVNTLPRPTKEGYEFVGWYTDQNFTSDIVTTVSNSATLYAKWLVDQSSITSDTILNCVSDVVESDTLDNLVSSTADATYKWTSSNPSLYIIENNTGKTIKSAQTHKKQKVTVSVEITYADGTHVTKSKEITINPVKYNDLPSTPVATYFYTGAMSAYKNYNERYNTDQTIFSTSTKEVLNLLYYSFFVPNSDGTIYCQDSSYLETVKELKNNDVRIIAVINGVGTSTSKYFYDICQDETKLNTFVNSMMNILETYNLDGIDIDWEYVSSSYPVTASLMNALMKKIREEMNKITDDGGTPYFLSCAIPASSWGTVTDRFDYATLNNYIDYINIMSYDLNNSSKCSHLSPLYTSNNDGGYGFGAYYGVNRIVSLGFPRNKLIIGSAGYGKAYKVTGTSSSSKYPALGASGTLTQISGISGSFSSGTLYGNAVKALIDSGNYTKYTEYDSNGRVVGSYLYNASSQIFVTYDSEEAVIAKYEYASSYDGVGIMCWAYSEDTSDNIINAIYKAYCNNK